MQPTIYGVIILLAGALLWRKGAAGLFAVTAMATAFGGSAAVLLPALGGTSIGPAQFSLLLPLLWVFLKKDHSGIEPAVMRNIFLVIFVLYGVAAAFLMPRLFEGQMYVAPMRAVVLNGQAFTAPLGPSTQNVTQSVYMIGTLVTALLSSYVAATSRDASLIIKTLVAATAVTVFLGLVDLVTWRIGMDGALDFLRNGAYAQLDQTVAGFRRISGQFPETSTYSTYGFALAALNGELWIRNIWPRVTGPLGLAMVLALIITTSSTSYLCLALYGLLLAVRLTILMSGPQKSAKLLLLCIVALGSVGFVLLLSLAMPEFTAVVTKVLLDMTVNKTASDSGQERLVWATQGLKAFVVSHGLGVGPGTFRSSSLVTAIIGSVGLVGSLAFLAHLTRVLAPWRRDSYSLQSNLGEAAASAALFGMFGAMISGATADPGLLFGLLGGFALGYRHRRGVDDQPVEDEAETAPLTPLERRRRRLAYLDELRARDAASTS